MSLYKEYYDEDAKIIHEYKTLSNKYMSGICMT